MKLCLRCNQYFEDGIELCPIDSSQLEGVGDHPLIGALINDRYVVDSVIGKGSTGIVYKATRLLMGSEVAVKVLHSYLGAEAGALDRFLREARAASRLRHPHIINIWEFGATDDGQPYFVMDYLEGMTLADMIKRQGFIHPMKMMPIIRQVCDALNEAHTRNIIHRDIKPENIVLQETDYERGQDFVKVLDFGIADQPAAAQGQKRTKMAAGSPAYMSPEQCQGFELDQRSDIYSLGIVVFEMLTGERPFVAEDVMNLFYQHVSKPPPAMGAVRTDVKFAPQLEAVVAKALAKKPGLRHASVKEFQKDLEDACKGSESGKKVDSIPMDLFSVPLGEMLTEGLTSSGSSPAMSSGNAGARKIIGNFLPGPEDMIDEPEPATAALPTAKTEPSPKPAVPAPPVADYQEAVSRLLKSAKKASDAVQTPGGPQPAPEGSSWAKDVLTRGPDSLPEPPKDSGVRIIPTESYRSITRSSASHKAVPQPLAPDTGADLLGGPAASQPAASAPVQHAGAGTTGATPVTPAPPATPVSPTSEAKPAAPTATKSGGNQPTVPPAGPVPEAPEVSTWAQRVLSRSSETEIPGGNGPGPSGTAKPPLTPAGQPAAKPLTPGGDKAQITPGAQPGQQAGTQAKQPGWPAVAPGQSQAKPQPGAPGTTSKPGASGTQSAMPGTPGARPQLPGQAPGAAPQAVRPGQGIAAAATSGGPTVPSSTGQRIAAQTGEPGGPQPGPGAQKGPAASGPEMLARPAQGQAPGAAKPGAPQPGQGMRPAQAGAAASGQGIPAQPGQGMKPAQAGAAASGQGLPAQPGQGMKPAQAGTAASGQGLPAQPGQGMKPAQAGTAASGQGLPAQPGQGMRPAQAGAAASGQGLPAQPGQGARLPQAGTGATSQSTPVKPGQPTQPQPGAPAASNQGMSALPGHVVKLGASAQGMPQAQPGQPTKPQQGAPAASNQGMSALPGHVVKLGASTQGMPPAQPGQPTKPPAGAPAASNQGMSGLPGHVVKLGASTQGMPPAQPGQPTKPPAGAPAASNQGMSGLPGHVVRLGASAQGLPPAQPGQGVKPPQQTGPGGSQGPTAQPGQLGQSGQTGPTGVQRQGQGQPQTAPGFPGQRVTGAQQAGPQMSGAGAQPGAARPQQQGAPASGGQGIASPAGAAPKPGAAAASSQGLPGQQQQRTGAPAAGQPLPGAQRAPGAGTPSSSFEPPKRPLGQEQKPAPPAAPETQPHINTSSGSPPSMPVDLSAEKGIGFDVPPTVMAAAQANSAARPDAQIEQADKLEGLSAGRETGFIDLPTLPQSGPSSQAEHASDVMAPAAADATASGTSDAAGEGTTAGIKAEGSEQAVSKSALAETEALSKLFPSQTAAVASTGTADVSSDFTPKTGVEQNSSLSELVGQPPPGAFSFAPNAPSPFVPGAGLGTAGDTAALQSSDSLATKAMPPHQGEAASPPGEATLAKGAGKERPKGFGGMAQAASRLLGSFNKGKDKAAADTSHTSLPVPSAPPEPVPPQMTLQERLAAAAMAGADKASANAGIGKSAIAAAASSDTSSAVSGPGSETPAPASGAETASPVPGSETPALPPGAETTSPAAAPAQAAFAPPPVPEPAPPASSLNAEPDKTGAIPSKFDSSSGRPADALNPFANAVESMLDASRVPQKPLGNDPFARSPEQTPVTSSSEQPSLSPKTDFAPPAEAEQPALAQPAAAESAGASAAPTSADPPSPFADTDEEGETVKHSPPVKSWDPKRFDRPINRGSLGEPSRFDAALDKALDTAIDAKNKRGFDSVRSDHPLDTALDAGAIIDPMRKSEEGGSRSSLIRPFADKPAMQTPAGASQEQPAIELPKSELPRSLSSQFTGGAEPKSAFNIKRFEDAVANPEKPVMDMKPGAQTDTASQEKPAFDPKRFEEPVNRGSEKINTFANAIDTLLDSAMMKPAPLESREQHETGMIDASIIRSYAAKPQSPQEPTPPLPKAEPFRVSEEEVHAATEDVNPITLSASAASTADGVPAPGGPDDKLSDAVSRLIEAAKRTPEPEVTSAAAKPEALNKKIEDVKKKIQALKAGAVPQPAVPTVAPPVAPPTSPPISANTGEASDAVNRLLEAAQSGIYQTVKKEPQSPAPPAQPPFTQKPNIKRSDTGMPEIKRPAEPAPASGQSSANWSAEAAARAADLVNAAAIKSQSQRVQTPDASDYYSGFKSAEKVDKMNKVEQRKKDRARLRNAAQMPPFWGWMLKLALLILAGVAACYTFHIDLSNYNPFTKPQSVKTTAATFEDSLKSGLDDAKSFLDKKMKTTPKLPQAELEKVYDEYLALAKKQAAAGKYVDAIQSLKNIPRRPKDRYRQAQSLSRTYKDKI